MLELKVRLEKHCKQLGKLKELIKFYEHKQCMFSSFQKMDIVSPEKLLSKDEELMWDRNVFNNLTRFNTTSSEISKRHIILETFINTQAQDVRL